jgi:hypothetical protein
LRLGEVAYQLTTVEFSQFLGAASWRPLVNVYRCGESVRICVDLEGVDKAEIICKWNCGDCSYAADDNYLNPRKKDANRCKFWQWKLTMDHLNGM